jgi:hypothetical protein
VQDNVQTKTTSKNYTVRVAYIMLSTFLYNIWVLANVALARKLHIELKKPRIKLSQLAHYFSMQIEQPYKPPLSLACGFTDWIGQRYKLVSSL